MSPEEIYALSQAQLRQDVFVMNELGYKRDGYFVEFGATNGKDLSNTYMLEKNFGWTGILAEPAHIWHDDLQKNRSCLLDFNCVWSKTGETVSFNEVTEAELSTIDTFSSADGHAAKRTSGNKYEVLTISLMDLLDKHDAPKVIDYLSIDTEGSELEILEAFNFDAYKFRTITCEHNYTPMREKIYDLLTSHGYVRKLSDFSYFDDWYVLEEKV